jgi:tRNA dimethylallyltransferase
LHALPVICLMGPTAAGKTQLAVELVTRYPFEIISVDSAMVYRDMDIGTAKPDAATLAIAPHALINICDPKDAYSGAQFCLDAQAAIAKCHQAQKIPLLVGGTMMYFHLLQNGLAIMPTADAACRAEIFAQAQELGWPAMHAKLVEIDPVAAMRIHPHDAQRLQRALEVFALTGKNLTTWHADTDPTNTSNQFINIALIPADRKILHTRIAARFQQLIDLGLVHEVQKLFARGDLNLETPAIRAVGYRQVWQYLQGELSYDEMIERGIIATRQLAKRQMTWLRRWPELKVFDSEEADLVLKVGSYLQLEVYL